MAIYTVMVMSDVSQPKKLSPRVIVVGVVVALGIVAFGLWPTKAPQKTQEVKDVALVADAQVPVLEEDLDHDGLKNWQEDIWGTDQNVAATDGDGTNDGDEVKIGRNPVKKAPGDKIEKKDFITPKKGANDYLYDNDPSLTTTDIIGRDVFSAYVAMKKGDTLTPDAVNAFAKEAAAKAAERSPAFTETYTQSNTKIIQDNSQEAYKTYANALGVLFAKYYGSTLNDIEKARQDEMGLIKKGISTEDAVALKALEKNSAFNTLFASTLMKIAVPSGLAQAHTAIANDYSIIAQALDRIVNIDTDPMGNISALQTYQKTLQDMAAHITTLRSGIASQHISFTPADPAYPYFGTVAESAKVN